MPQDLQIATLLDENEIRKTVYRYCRGVDRRDFELVRSCYHPDAVDHHGILTGVRDSFIEYIRSSLEAYESTLHFLGNVLIEVDGDSAGVESYAVAHHRLAARGSRPTRDYVVGMRYVDRFERREFGWRIAERWCAFDWSRLDPVAPGGELNPGWTLGVRGPDDVSYRFLPGAPGGA
jgi:hypothetical protein